MQSAAVKCLRNRQPGYYWLIMNHGIFIELHHALTINQFQIICFQILTLPNRAHYYKFGSVSIPSNVKEGLVVYGLVARRKGFRASH